MPGANPKAGVLFAVSQHQSDAAAQLVLSAFVIVLGLILVPLGFVFGHAWETKAGGITVLVAGLVLLVISRASKAHRIEVFESYLVVHRLRKPPRRVAASQIEALGTPLYANTEVGLVGKNAKGRKLFKARGTCLGYIEFIDWLTTNCPELPLPSSTFRPGF
ncbi:MAG: hypothetical protein FWD29_05460 [Micrococcales bacterium]|nr:hypothetical protein [Micrococcales bacterium]